MPNVTRGYQCAPQLDSANNSSYSIAKLMQNVSAMTANTYSSGGEIESIGEACTMLVSNIPTCHQYNISVTPDAVNEVTASGDAQTPAEFTVATGHEATHYAVGKQLHLSKPGDGMTTLSTTTYKVLNVTDPTDGTLDLQLAEPVSTIDIEGFTGAANTTITAAASHGINVNEFIVIGGLKGDLTELNSKIPYKVTNVSTNDLTIKEVDGTTSIDTQHLSGVTYASADHAGTIHKQTAVITAATYATPMVLTTQADHGLAVGQHVILGGFPADWDNGLDGKLFEVSAVGSTDTFEIKVPGASASLDATNLPAGSSDNVPSANLTGASAAVIPIGFEAEAVNTSGATAHTLSDTPIDIMPVRNIIGTSLNSVGHLVLTLSPESVANNEFLPGDTIHIDNILVGATELNGETHVINKVTGDDVTLLTKYGELSATAYSSTTSSNTNSFLGPLAYVQRTNSTNAIPLDSIHMTFMTETIEPLELPPHQRGKPLLKTLKLTDLSPQVPADSAAMPEFFGAAVADPAPTAPTDSAGYYKALFPFSNSDMDTLYGPDVAKKMINGTLIGPYGSAATRAPGVIATEFQVQTSLPWGSNGLIFFPIAHAPSATPPADNSDMNASDAALITHDTVDTFYGAATRGDNAKVTTLDADSSAIVHIGRTQDKVLCPFHGDFAAEPGFVATPFLVGDDGAITGRVNLISYYDELQTVMIPKTVGGVVVQKKAAVVDVVIGKEGEIIKSKIYAEITEENSGATNLWEMYTRAQVLIPNLENEVEVEAYLAPQHVQVAGAFETVGSVVKYIDNTINWRSEFSNSTVAKPSAQKIGAPEQVSVLNNFVQTTSGTVTDANGVNYGRSFTKPLKVVYEDVPISKATFYSGLAVDRNQRSEYINLYTSYYATSAEAVANSGIPDGGQVGGNDLVVGMQVTFTDVAGNPLPATAGVPNTVQGPMVPIPTTYNDLPIVTGWNKRYVTPPARLSVLRRLIGQMSAKIQMSWRRAPP